MKRAIRLLTLVLLFGTRGALGAERATTIFWVVPSAATRCATGEDFATELARRSKHVRLGRAEEAGLTFRIELFEEHAAARGRLTDSGTGGAQVAHGDSGGPWIRGSHQMGVMSSANLLYAVARRSVHWIVSQHLGRLYLRPYVGSWRAMKWSGQGWGANVTAELPAADYFQWWEYNWQTREIRAASAADGATCLDLQYNNPADNTPIGMWGCNSGDAQKWVITPLYQIK